MDSEKKLCLGILRLGPRGTFGSHLKYFTQTSLFSRFYLIFSLYFRVSGQVPSQEENVNTTYPSGVPRELSLILKEIKVITDKIRDDEESSAIESDWKFAAMVLDRLCLITFTLFTIVATLAVLAAAPHVIVK